MRLVRVGLSVDIDMADAVKMLENRHLTLGHHTFDQAFAAAGHYQVDIFRHGEQRAHRGTIHHRHYLRCIHGQARRREPVGQ